jgi:uncharacterized protein YjdB
MSGSITLRINQSVTFTTLIDDSYGASTSAKTINYISNNPDVAVVGNPGNFVVGSVPQNSVSTNTITGISNGSAVISVTIDGGIVIDIISVTVESNPPAKLNFIFGTPTP